LNTYDFLSHLRTLDIQLAVEDGKLRVNAPKGTVTSELKSELAERKEEILALLSQFEPIQPPAHNSSPPLSLGQEHLWQLHRLAPDTAAYNMHAIFNLSGSLNIPAIESALRQVAERHPSIRAYFSKNADGIPELCTAPASSIVLQQVPLTPSKQDGELQAIIDAAVRLPFDLTTGPLFCPTLVRISPTEHVLILVMHHIISDGHSFKVIYADLEQAYQAECEGGLAKWPPLPLEYGDYAAWQLRWLAANASAPDRNYWYERLSGDVPALELPFDHPHPLRQTADGDDVELQFPPHIGYTLLEFCRQEGVTLFTAAYTALNLLLHRQSGQRDLVICTPVAARDRSEYSHLVGYFNNTLILRTHLTSALSIRDLLKQSQAVVSGALAHQMFPFKEVTNFPGLAQTPLSRAGLVVQNAVENVFKLPGLEIKMLPSPVNMVQYDLSVEITAHPNHLTGRMLYRKALFERATVENLAKAFVGIIEEMLADAQSAINPHGSRLLADKQRAAEKQRGMDIQRSAETRKPPFTAPRSDLEHQLAKIWQEVLEVESIGVYDEFFALGGHSLLALRLFTRIEQETRTSLPLSTLFQTTTIAHLASLIEGKANNGSWECLVPLQSQGSKPPFFLVHGIGGGVLGYRDLVNSLSADQPVFGLQAAGQDGREGYDHTIEAMAARNIMAMRNQQPHGPYRIGGYCFGGVVAYEMAVQLQKMGEQVSLLAIFEGAMPDGTATKVSAAQRLAVFLKTIPAWVSDYSSLPPSQIMNRVRSTIYKVWAKIQRNPNLRRRVRVEETLDIAIDSLPKSNIELTDVHLQAALDYIPGKFDGQATLFRARHRSINEVVFGSLDPRMGWGEYARGGVTVQLVDGYHRNMHLAPYVPSLAAELQKHLD
jgi:thioesterase domain-containing protein/acyl carrier protein